MSSGVGCFSLLLLFAAFSHISSDSLPTSCSLCPGPSNTSYVISYCEEYNITKDLRLYKSCCLNTSEPTQQNVLGLDLSSCNLDSISGLLSGTDNLKVLMLENNSKLHPDTQDFRGLVHLEYLSLPARTECPGGNHSWEDVEVGEDLVKCLHEVNLCKENNVTCLNSNSHCVLLAPGEMQCLCNDGFYGYKCLRQGTFPYVSYAAVLASSTVVVSGLLWCTQRRKVKKRTHRD